MTTKKQEPTVVKDLSAEEKAGEIKGGLGDGSVRPTAITPTVGGIANPIIRTGFPK